MTSGKSRILILSPHADDGELGCGGSISRLTRERESEVRYLAFSYLPEFRDGVLAHECTQAALILGMGIELLDYPVRRFPDFRQEILEKMVAVNRDFQPTLVFTPSRFDVHQDHQTVTNEALRAFKHTTVLGYEAPWNNYQIETDFFMRLTEADITRKYDAMRCYESQSERVYMRKDFIFGLAKTRGVQVDAEFAEAFHVLRIVQ